MSQGAEPPPPDETQVRRTNRAARLLTGAVVLLLLLGAAARVREWAFNRSLWLDESLIARNLLDRGFLGLLRPLDHLQTGPLLFLWSSEAMSRVLGPWEWSLRLPSLAAGLAGLGLIALVARRMLREPAALLAVVALAAVSPQLIFYASELKPYALDVAAGALLTWLGLRLLASLNPPGSPAFRREVVRYTAGGAVALFASSPSVFVIAGVGVVLMARAATARRWRALLAVAASSAITAVAFGLHYALVLRHAAAEADFYRLWGGSFAGGRLRWLLDSTIRFLTEGLWLRHYGPILLLLVVGFVWLAARRPWALALAFAPVLVTYAASRAGLYPIGPRVIMYLAPVTLVCVGGGVEAVAGLARALAGIGRRPAPARWAGAVAGGVVALVIVVPPTRVTLDRFLAPPGREEIRPLLEEIAARRAAGQAVWVSDRAASAYDYYARTRPELALDPADGPVLLSQLRLPEPEEIVAEADGLAGDGGVWLLYSHLRVKAVYNPVAASLAETREPEEGRAVAGARLYRFGPPRRGPTTRTATAGPD